MAYSSPIAASAVSRPSRTRHSSRRAKLSAASARGRAARGHRCRSRRRAGARRGWRFSRLPPRRDRRPCPGAGQLRPAGRRADRLVGEPSRGPIERCPQLVLWSCTANRSGTSAACSRRFSRSGKKGPARPAGGATISYSPAAALTFPSTPAYSYEALSAESADGISDAASDAASSWRLGCRSQRV